MERARDEISHWAEYDYIIVNDDVAESLAQVFHHDPDPWDGEPIPHGELRRLTGAVRRRRLTRSVKKEPAPARPGPVQRI